MAEVSINGVYKYYTGAEDKAAVKDLNLHINDGEFVAILGPSGCGKSSTMRMICGLEHISAGTIKFGDTVVNNLPPKDRDIAMVFENYALYPHKTVYDNIANPLKLAKVDKQEIDTRVVAAAQLLEIEHLLDRKPQELSGGQKQRVAIGLAIVRKPQVFLFDEPIAHLDAKLRARMRSELKRLQAELGVTSLYVTHDQLEALSMADRVAVMHDGVLQQFDTPQTVYDKPANAWVATFVGEPQMSLLECEIERGSDPLKLLFHNHPIEVDPVITDLLDKCGLNHVLVGFRPANVKVDVEYMDNSIAGSVYSRQLLGGELLIEVQVGDTIVRAIVETEFTLKIGDPCHLKFSKSSLNIFNKDSGAALY